VVEGVEVGCGVGGEFLDLALAQPDSGCSFDRVERTVERASRCFDRGEQAQPVGMLLGGQVERGVGGVQVGVPACPRAR
jgi:hypothetical protein